MSTPRKSPLDPAASVAPPPWPSGRAVLLSAASLVGALAVAGVINLARLHHLTSDQLAIAPMVQKILEPDLFLRDPVYHDPANYAFYLPYFRGMLEQLTLWSGSITLAFWLLMLATTGITLGGFWLLLLRLEVSPAWSSAGAILCSLPRLAPCEEITGAGLTETALPRTLFSMLLPPVLLILLRSRGRGIECLLAFLAAGLAANLHPQSGMFLVLTLAVVVLWYRWREAGGWLTAAAGGLVAMVACLPFIMTFPWDILARPTTGSGAGRAVLDVKILAVFAACVAPMYAAAWLARRPDSGEARDAAARMSFRAAVIAGVLVPAAVLLCISLSSLGMRGWLLFFSTQWLRSMRLVAPLATVAAILWAAGRAGAAPRALAHLRYVVPLLVLPAVLTVGALEYVHAKRYRPIEEIAPAVMQQTPPDAVILADPMGGSALRLWAKRSVLWTHHDIHFIQERKQRWAAKAFVAEVDEAYEDRDVAALVKIARENGADYLLAPAPETAGSAPGGYRLMKVPRE